LGCTLILNPNNDQGFDVDFKDCMYNPPKIEKTNYFSASFWRLLYLEISNVALANPMS